MTYANILQAVKDEIVIATSTFFSDTILGRFIDLAYKRAAMRHKWPQLERTATQNTAAGTETYAYPTVTTTAEVFRTDGIKIVYIGGVPYAKRMFKDYQKNRYDNPSGTNDKFISDWQRTIYVYPTPSSIVAMVVYGYIIPNTFTTGDSFFTPGDQEGDLAIIKYAKAYALRRGGKDQLAMIEEQAADALLDQVWGQYKLDQQEYQNIQPHFDVPDFFAPGGNNSSVGTFNSF